MKYALKKLASAASVCLVVVAGAATASASPVFSINPSVLTGGPTSATGTNFKGTSSELLHLFNAGDTLPAIWGGGSSSFTGNYASGYFRIQSLQDDNGNVQDSGINPNATAGGPGDYKLYLTFSLLAELTGGSNGVNGSTYALRGLNFVVWGDPDENNVFTSATTVGGLGVEASVTNMGDDVALAIGSLLGGTATINSGGVALNALNSFGVCNGNDSASFGGNIVTGSAVSVCDDAKGSQYFFDPNPFYQLAFSAFNNTVGNTTVNSDGTVAIASAVATVDFRSVPEPASLALIGVGLAGMGLSSRRRKAIRDLQAR